MARPITVSFRGLKEVNAKLRQMDDAISAAAMRGVVLAGADMIRQRSVQILQSGVRRSTKNRPGWAHLEDAIIAQSGKSETYVKAWAKTIHKLAPQGLWIEFGHRVVGHKPKHAMTGKMTRAFPFFRRAVDEMVPKVKSLINLAIRRMLEGGTVERQIKITAGGKVSKRL